MHALTKMLESTTIIASALNSTTFSPSAVKYILRKQDFWKSLLADPSEDGACLDLYTQKGGVGPNVTGGDFTAGEIVHLISKVTYNNVRYKINWLHLRF